MFPPDRCTFEKNVVEDNTGPGFYISAGIAGTVLTENVIRDTRKEEAQRTQKVALFSFSPVAMKDNKVEGQVRVPPSKDGSAAK
jgi:parallel beta-helix repeat protein